MLATTTTRALRLPAARLLTTPSLAVRAISTTAPTQLANAVTEAPKRREVLLPSQEKPNSLMQYALYVLPVTISPFQSSRISNTSTVLLLMSSPTGPVKAPSGPSPSVSPAAPSR